MRDEQAERIEARLREMAWRVVELRDWEQETPTGEWQDHCRQLRRSIEAIRHELAGSAS